MKNSAASLPQASAPAVQTRARGSWREILRNDYTLAVISLGGLVAALWLAPFAIWRALQGNWLAMANDTVLTILLGGGAIYAWRTGDTRWPGWIMAICTVCGILAIGYAAQFAALFWVYPAILMMFFLVPPKAAFVMCALAVAGAASLSWQELGGTQGLPFFLVTNVLTAVLSYLLNQQANRRIDRWQVLSLVDPLTGAGNRRAMELELTWGFSGPHSAGSLAVIDLDHFKRINDTHGHDEGDRVLCEVADTIRRVLRASDRLYRLGGEEFVLWLPEADARAALSVLVRVRKAVREGVWVGGAPVTFSAGVARHEPPQSWRTCLELADAALYRAKDLGRDRVCWANCDGFASPTGAAAPVDGEAAAVRSDRRPQVAPVSANATAPVGAQSGS